MLNFDRGVNFEQKCTPLPDRPDLPDSGHGLLFGTYHPSRAGVRMTVVLNKLLQIIIHATPNQFMFGKAFFVEATAQAYYHTRDPKSV